MGRLIANAAVVVLLALSLAPGTAAFSPPPVPRDAAPTVTSEWHTGCAREVLPKLETDMTGKNAEETERLQALYEEQPGFLGVVRGGGQFWVIVDSNVEAWADKVADEGATVVSSCVQTGVLDSAKKVISDATHDSGEFSSVAYNVFTDSVELATTLDVGLIRDAVGDEFQKTTGALLDLALANADLVIVASAPSADNRLAGRLTDTTPFYGGAKVIYPNGSGCSTGFHINSGTNGTVMVTAGHCGTNGSVLVNGQGSIVVGTVEGRSLPDPDLALIDGKDYAGRSYSANNTSSSKRITDARNPGTGTLYCQMGYKVQRLCASYSSLSAQYCDIQGCTNLLAFTSRSCDIGVLGLPGDSGGGVFLEFADGTLGARGIVVAGPVIGTNTCTRYDHRWGTILVRYDATIVIGT